MSNALAAEQKFKYQWFTLGDLNAFFGLMVDNVTNLVILAGILVFGFGYPEQYVYTKMIPGTALGVMFGDIIYTIMAFNLANKKKSSNVTAMPLGLDTPSTIGIAVAVLGPAYIASGKNPEIAWQVGMATMILIGVLKLFMSFIGEYVQKIVPKAGLLGSIGGIGIALIGFLPLVTLFQMPIVGLVVLGIILYSLVAKQALFSMNLMVRPLGIGLLAVLPILTLFKMSTLALIIVGIFVYSLISKIDLPFNAPGVFVAVVFGAALYHILGPLGLLGAAKYEMPHLAFSMNFPIPSLAFMDGMSEAIKYLPIAFPFGLLTIIGGINVTESAKCAGDDYNTRNILLTEAFATLLAGITGGVAQSTPYIGHPAYKSMGARAGYTLATGLFIGIGGMFGVLTWMLQVLPEACVAPILIFVGLEIASQAYQECPHEHAPAVTFAFMPIIANLLLIMISQIRGEFFGFLSTLPADMAAKFSFSEGLQSKLDVITALGQGFILTAMLWGGALALIIDKKLSKAGHYFMITAFLTLFGIIHSVSPSGDVYLPWRVNSVLPIQFAASYFLLGLLMYMFNTMKSGSEAEGPGSNGEGEKKEAAAQ
jgi:AGZA family xanthine/uracil permease-like MFS transporter